MDLQLSGKTALVTGAGSGIGRSIALALAREGAHLVLADRDLAGCEQTLAQVRAAVPGARGIARRADVAKLEQFLADVEKALMVAPYRGETHNTVVDTILESVSIKPFDPDDGLLNGSVTVTVRYRHNAADPSGVPG